MLGALQVRLDRGRAARSTARTPAPCGRRRRLSRAPRRSALDLRRACRACCPGTSAGWQAAWRRRSSASSAASTLPPLVEQRDHLLARGGADRVVDARARVVELARAARPRCAAAARARRRCLRRRSTNGRIRSRSRSAAPASPLGDGPGVALLEVAAAAEQAAVGEVQQAPQLLEPVLDRRAGERDAEAPRERDRRRAPPGCRGS